MYRKIAFVCLGNICRSPTAESIAKKRVVERGLSIDIESFGTGSWHVGGDADAQALRALKRAGYSLENHRARQILPSGGDDEVLYVALDYSNYRDLSKFAFFVSHPDHLTMLRFFDPQLSNLAKRPSKSFDVDDPYHLDDEFYDQTLKTIERCIDPLIDYVTVGRS
ncbi:MAG: low molecular weight phosphotyrosine protein phosphatase [Actinomycetota bacterium]|nr:low molecular weight phosphotyrosine protein phosphatase [Actinomycetota bacterium]